MNGPLPIRPNESSAILSEWLRLFAAFVFIPIIGVMIAALHALVSWHLPMLVVTFLSLLFFPLLFGLLIRRLTRQFQFQEYSQIIVSLISGALLWWMFWVFWLDLYLNQTRWIKLDIPLVPLDYIQLSTFDPYQAWGLLIRPGKVSASLSVFFENGYYSIFDIRPSGWFLCCLWLIEVALMSFTVYLTVASAAEGAILENQAGPPKEVYSTDTEHTGEVNS